MHTSFKHNNEQAVIIFIRGLPGSGKSYLAKQLEAAINKQSVVVLDPDATDYNSQAYAEHVKSQTEEGVDPKLHAYRFLRAQAYDAIATKKIAIWNQPFSNLEIFDKVVARMEEFATDQEVKLSILIIEVDIDPKIAKKRVEARKQDGGHGPSDATFERFVNDYASLINRGYHVVGVKGDDSVDSSVDAVIQAITTATA